MSRWLVGSSFLGYGVTLTIGIGIPIPVLNEEIVKYTAVKDEDIYTQIVDYSEAYPQGKPESLGEIDYKSLKSGSIKVKGRDVPTAALSSYNRAVEIAEKIRSAVEKKDFRLRRELTKATVSIGVAVFPDDAKTKDDLMRAADNNLYRAKNEGRNRVCVS